VAAVHCPGDLRFLLVFATATALTDLNTSRPPQTLTRPRPRLYGIGRSGVAHDFVRGRESAVRGLWVLSWARGAEAHTEKEFTPLCGKPYCLTIEAAHARPYLRPWLYRPKIKKSVALQTSGLGVVRRPEELRRSRIQDAGCAHARLDGQ
jgi:hypothetical protein